MYVSVKEAGSNVDFSFCIFLYRVSHLIQPLKHLFSIDLQFKGGSSKNVVFGCLVL